MANLPMLAGIWFISDLLLCDLIRRTKQFKDVERIADIDLLRPWTDEVESI